MPDRDVPPRRGWSWRPAAGVAAAVTLLVAAVTVSSDQPVVAGLVVAAANGVAIFFLIAGVQAASTGRYPPVALAASTAAATFATVFTLDLMARVLGAGAQDGGILDVVSLVLLRALVVFAVVALTARWSARR